MGANAVTEKAVPMRNQQLSKIEDPTQRNQKYSTAGIEYGEMAADRKHNAKTAQKVSLVNTLGRRTRGGKGACVCVCFFFLHSFSKKSLVRASTFGWLHCWPPGMEVFVKKTSHGAGGCPKTPLEKCCQMQW